VIGLAETYAQAGRSAGLPAGTRHHIVLDGWKNGWTIEGLSARSTCVRYAPADLSAVRSTCRSSPCRALLALVAGAASAAVAPNACCSPTGKGRAGAFRVRQRRPAIEPVAEPEAAQLIPGTWRQAITAARQVAGGASRCCAVASRGPASRRKNDGEVDEPGLGDR
jgi:hypothetical protein